MKTTKPRIDEDHCKGCKCRVSPPNVYCNTCRAKVDKSVAKLRAQLERAA